MRARQNGSSGYSLSELLVVVAMVGIITMVTLPAFMQLMPQYRIRSAASDAAAAIRMIRQKAMTKRTVHRISFDAANERYSYWILKAPTLSMSLASSWSPLSTDARQIETTEQFINTVSVDLRVATPNPFKDVDCPSDATVDLVFLRDGSVSTQPACGGTSPTNDLTFGTPPSVLFAVDNHRVRFNRYYLSLTRSGTVTVTPAKE